jgi:hypothetical protein
MKYILKSSQQVNMYQQSKKKKKATTTENWLHNREACQPSLFNQL